MYRDDLYIKKTYYMNCHRISLDCLVIFNVFFFMEIILIHHLRIRKRHDILSKLNYFKRKGSLWAIRCFVCYSFNYE